MTPAYGRPRPCLRRFGRDRPRPNQRSEHFLARTAYRALPIFRQILKPGTFWDLPFPVSSVRIINVPAIYGLALPHLFRSRHPNIPPFLSPKPACGFLVNSLYGIPSSFFQRVKLPMPRTVVAVGFSYIPNLSFPFLGLLSDEVAFTSL